MRKPCKLQEIPAGEAWSKSGSFFVCFALIVWVLLFCLFFDTGFCLTSGS